MNDEYVCEVYNKSQVQDKRNCLWERKDNKFTFTLLNPEGLHKNNFSCEMSKIKPFPVTMKVGPKTKLFRGKFIQCKQHSSSFLYTQKCMQRMWNISDLVWILHLKKHNNNNLYTIFFKGCNKSLAPLKNSCPITNQTNNQDHRPVESYTPEEVYTLLICGLIIVVVMLSVYSIIVTAVYIRLRVTYWLTFYFMFVLFCLYHWISCILSVSCLYTYLVALVYLIKMERLCYIVSILQSLCCCYAQRIDYIHNTALPQGHYCFYKASTT